MDISDLVVIRQQGNETICRCPFCGDSPNERKGHLYVRRDGVYFCHRCHAKGRLDRINEDIVSAQRPVPVNSPIVGEVYKAFLSMLKLHSRHKEDLLRRGLSETEIHKRGYKSLPDDPRERRRIVKELAERYDLSRVPGFKLEPYPDCMPGPGYLIPVRQPDGRITAMQIRRDPPGTITQYRAGTVKVTVGDITVTAGEPIFQQGLFIPPLSPGKTVQAKYNKDCAWKVSGPAVVGNDPKYLWFSLGGLEAKAHFLPGKGGTVWIVEGILKTDIAHSFLNVPMIGIAGTAMWRKIEWERVLARNIVLAFDNEDNEITKEEVRNLCCALKKMGKNPYLAKWDRSLGKGIDDACLSLKNQGVHATPEMFL